MTRAIQFDPVQLPPEAEAMRERVRDFLEQEARAGTFAPNGLGMTGHSPEFSQRCGAAGFIGMTWPRKYGGGERGFLERFVVSEEMIAAGAAVWAHWVADRQSGPMLIHYGRDAMRQRILPRIIAGACYF